MVTITSELEMNKLWMTNHPELAVRAILRFMEKNDNVRMRNEPTENYLTVYGAERYESEK